jgi:ethanolamine utilization protein EutA
VMREDLGVKVEILVIDGVTSRDFDYIDLGKIRLPSRTVPVTIKSLVFGDVPLMHHGDVAESQDTRVREK